MVTLPQLCQVVNFNSFICSTLKSITTELDHKVFTLQVIKTSSMLGFISNSKSHVATKLDRILDQRTITARSWC